jgi:hypothetical protein
MPSVANFIEVCGQFPKDMMIRVLKKLVANANAQPYSKTRGGMSILHWLYYGDRCIVDMLEVLVGPLTKQNLQMTGLYYDDYGANVLDYTMSITDSRRNPPYNRLCWIQSSRNSLGLFMPPKTLD